MLASSLILAAGLVVDAAFGEMGPVFRVIPHPVAALGAVIGWADRHLNRLERSPSERRFRGVLLLIILVSACAGLGWLLHVWAQSVPLGWVVEVLCIGILVAQRSLFSHVRQVASALKSDGLAAGREKVARIVGRDVTRLDDHGVARAAIESLAENFADGVVAPVFWYVVLGLPGLFAYKAVNTLDSMVGYRSPSYVDFGWASARFDDLANLVPARLAGCMVAIATMFAPGGNPLAAFRVMVNDHGNHPSPNSGWPESAMAGGLGLALAGPRQYPGGVVEGQWIGSGRAMANASDIDRALVAFVGACLINAGIAIQVLGS